VATLTNNAPVPMRRRYLARVAAQGSGRCPLCAQVADISGPDPEHGRRAGYRLLPVTVGVRHVTGCPASDFTDADRRWFEPPTGPDRNNDERNS